MGEYVTVVGSKKLGECSICKEEIIQLDTSDNKSKIYAPHIDGCPLKPTTSTTLLEGGK